MNIKDAPEDGFKTNWKKIMQNLGQTFAETEEQLKQLEQISEKCKALKKNQEQITEQSVELERKERETDQCLTESKLVYTKVQAEYQTAKEKLPYETIEEAEKHLAQTVGALEQLRKNYETVTRRLTEMQNKEKELEGRSKTVKASALQSQKEAEKKMEQAETKVRNEKKRAELEIRKAKKEVKARTEKMRDTEYFWGMGYITVILFVIIQNGAFQNDFIDFFRTPFMWYFQFCEWLAHPTYDNGFNQKIAYTCGEAWVIRILAIVAVLLIVVIIMAIIMEIIKKYKKMWDKISQMFLIGSLSGIAVLGDVIRECLPVNLILTFGFINVGIMLLKIYFQKKFEEKSLYTDNHYD